MNRLNYDRDMQALMDRTRAAGKRPRLLLHCCCAPCSTAVVERLTQAFEVDLYYYNPNIDTGQEHQLRADELTRLAAHLAPGAQAIITRYDPQAWQQAVRGLEDEPEGGARCVRCFGMRLQESARYAKAHGYDWFTTTLTISPMKNAGLLNGLGAAIGREVGVPFLCSDFKKRGGYQRSVELSRVHGLYRQDYCGCAFSKLKAQNKQAQPEQLRPKKE